MSSFKPFSKNNPCPVCDKASIDCRYSIDDPDFILCHSFVDARKGDKINSFVCVRESSGGHTASFKPDTSQEWNEERRREWQEAKAIRLANKERDKQQALAKLLPIPERDTQYRQISRNLGLSQKHRSDLLSDRRGLKNTEIDFAISHDYLCSWMPGTKSDASPNLAGIAAGKLVGTRGIGIAAHSPQGQITGFQIANDDREYAKYPWLSSAKYGGNSSHLPNGELPIFVWDHPEAEGITEIWLIEGGLKSLIVALKLWLRHNRKDIRIVGASGGNWHSSINAVVESLGDTEQVILFPDGGSLLNNHILGNYRKIIDELSARNYSVSVAWWDQISKNKNDIDEIANPLSFQLIEPKEFFGFKLEQKANWAKARQFKADIIQNNRNFSFPEIPASGVVAAVKSGLGTGKTEALIKLIKSSSNRAFLIGYRNNLLLQTGNRASQKGLSIYHLQHDGGIDLVADESTNLALCLDSIHHVDGYFSGADIYLDEIVSVLSHACTGGTLGKEQGKAIAILSKALKECNRVILLDGNLADNHAEFIAKISGKRLIKIENQAKISPHNFKFIVGLDAEGEIKKRDKSPIIKAMLADGVIPWIACDSRTQTNIIDEIFKQNGKHGYVLNGDTVGEPWAKECLLNPDAFIEKYRPEYFAISPSAESGVSITIKNYFTDKFTIFCGIQGTNSQHQMLFRLRDDSIPHYIFCPEFSQIQAGDRKSPNAYSVESFLRIQNEAIMQGALLAAGGAENIMQVIGKAISRSSDDWWQLSAQMGFADSYEMKNLRECLIYALSEAGHNIEVLEWEISEDFKNIEKSAKEVIQHRHAKEIFQAEAFKSLELANQAAKANPNKEMQRRIEKTRLLDRLPGIEESSSWDADFICEHYIKDRHFISKHQRFYMLNHFDISQKRSEMNWYYLATNDNFFLGQAKGDSHLKIWALKELNILQFMEGDYHKDSPEVIEVINRVRNDKELQRALNIKPPKESLSKKENIEFIAQLLDSIGLRFAKYRQILLEGVKTRIHTLDREKMNLPSRLDTLAAIERKFDGYLNSESVAKINWESQSPPPMQPQLPETQPQLPESQAEVLNSTSITPHQAEVEDTASLDDWLSESNICYLVDCLESCENAGMLNDLRAIAPAKALRIAGRNLSIGAKSRIRKWLEQGGDMAA